MYPRLRIGIADAGAISQYDLAGQTEMAAAQVVAICDIDGAKARAKAEAFGVASVYSDFRARLRPAAHRSYRDHGQPRNAGI